MPEIIKLEHKNLVARINAKNQQLFSLDKNNLEYMWGGGAPKELKKDLEKPEFGGWQNSEIIMFPVVGPVNNNEITVDNARYEMGQHGIARYVDFEIGSQSKTHVAFKQTYAANTEIKSEKGMFKFPFSYELYKTYQVSDKGLEFELCAKNISEKEMPYAIGWHPAFVLMYWGAGEEHIRVPNAGTWSAAVVQEQIRKEGAVIHENTKELQLLRPDFKPRLQVESTLSHLMLWGNKNFPILCIEPISALPDGKYSGELKDKKGYKILQPGERKNNYISIKV